MTPSRTLDPVTRVAALLLVVIVGYALLGPLLAPVDADTIDWDALEAAPDGKHWFGTDLAGRDLFARAADGARVSLTVALVATGVSVLIGLPWGALAGYAGGRTDQLLMRVVDVLYGLPFILIVIVLVVVFGRSPVLLYVGLGAVFWLDLARIVRGQTLRLRHEAFVLAARALGAPAWLIIARHILPNVAGPAIAWITLTLPGVILAESFVSFLGLGIQEPDTSWGVLIADGTQSLESAPWTLLIPAALLGVTVWSVSMLGDYLRDRLDPHQRGP